MKMKVLPLFALAAWLLFSAPAIVAATFTVSNTNDSGPGSFRQAILDANAASGDDDIAFSALFDTPQTITLTTGVINVSGVGGGVFINGPGANKLTLSGNNQTRVFFVMSGANLRLRDFRITSARATGGLGGAVSSQVSTLVTIERMVFDGNFATDGAALFNTGMMNISDSVLDMNTAVNGSGAAITTFGGTVTISRCVITRNSGVEGGAIVQSAGSMTITDTVISNNQSLLSGGGLKITGTVSIIRTLISGNRGGPIGGGISSSGTLAMLDSTISGNTATDVGGGLAVTGGSTSLNHTTIAFNSSSNSAGGVGVGVSGTLNTRNSIIAKNSSVVPDPDISGTITSQGYNLFGNTAGGTIIGTTTGNKLDIDPLLGLLAHNGGLTRTHALGSGSPAIDAGDPANFSPDDQRVVARPRDGDLNGSALPDMGAFEREPVLDNPLFDFDGDGKTDIGIFRPSVGQWWIDRSNAGLFATQFGSTSDIITPGDFTSDGKADIAFWRPATGEWYVLKSEDFSFFAFPFGANGDIPTPADFDADGQTDAAVFRPSAATWFIQRSTSGIHIEQFGANGDVPVTADYDGDSSSDIGIFRPSNGQWWINRSTAGLIAMTFGNASDKPVQGDYTGDGKADVAFWRPSTGDWFVLRSEDFSFFSFPFGTSGDTPAPGDYDGDGRHDATVFRPSNATWYSQRTTAGTLIQQFGATGDRPIPNAYVP